MMILISHMLIIDYYSSENAFEQLRKQYLKRAPETTLLGTVEEPVEWAALGLSQKVLKISFLPDTLLICH